MFWEIQLFKKQKLKFKIFFEGCWIIKREKESDRNGKFFVAKMFYFLDNIKKSKSKDIYKTYSDALTIFEGSLPFKWWKYFIVVINSHIMIIKLML